MISCASGARRALNQIPPSGFFRRSGDDVAADLHHYSHLGAKTLRYRSALAIFVVGDTPTRQRCWRDRTGRATVTAASRTPACPRNLEGPCTIFTSENCSPSGARLSYTARYARSHPHRKASVVQRTTRVQRRYLLLIARSLAWSAQDLRHELHMTKLVFRLNFAAQGMIEIT